MQEKRRQEDKHYSHLSSEYHINICMFISRRTEFILTHIHSPSKSSTKLQQVTYKSLNTSSKSAYLFICMCFNYLFLAAKVLCLTTLRWCCCFCPSRCRLPSGWNSALTNTDRAGCRRQGLPFVCLQWLAHCLYKSYIIISNYLLLFTHTKSCNQLTTHLPKGFTLREIQLQDVTLNGIKKCLCRFWQQQAFLYHLSDYFCLSSQDDATGLLGHDAGHVVGVDGQKQCASFFHLDNASWWCCIAHMQHSNLPNWLIP